jgi:hypothetical protein
VEHAKYGKNWNKNPGQPENGRAGQIDPVNVMILLASRHDTAYDILRHG